MIETFYGLDTLQTPRAFLAALLIGLLFGFALERAGFGSSRKLTGVFYFRDMAVFKVMFTALIVGMLGLSYCMAFGWIAPEQLYLMPTVYGAQIVGGLVFGVGFVMGGWCPGTAAVGVASGKADAVVFLGGTALGSILFSEVFPFVRGLYEWGGRGVLMVYDSVGMSRPAFIFLFSFVIIGAFWGCELVEKKRTGFSPCLNTPLMRAFTVGLLALAAGLFIIPASARDVAPAAAALAGAPSVAVQEQSLLASVEAAADHMEPEELADRLMREPDGLTVVDVRPAAEFDAFHIRGAINVPLAALADALAPQRNKGLVVLYSNGMTHPAQARDSLARLGFANVYILTDGLAGFVERCLKPVSLRAEPMSAEAAARVSSWRGYFAAGQGAAGAAVSAVGAGAADEPMPGLVGTDWLAARVGDPHVRVIDLRSQPEYNTAHVPGAVCLSVESVRGVVGNVSSMLLPRDMLARHFSLMGILPTDTVVFVPGDKVHDATMAAMACERLGHMRYGILNGGFGKWAAEKRPVDAALPGFVESSYPAGAGPDGFTVGYEEVLAHVKAGDATIIDVRPAEYYQGTKSDEARAGHILGAVSRPMTDDVVKADGYSRLKPVEELAPAYAALIPSKDATVIVHCRTGHQASQTYFVLRRLLGYRKVLWYDGSWSEWSARPELPIVGP